MILNSARQTVEKWKQAGQGPSTCPHCNAPLVARQCELKVDHFAHYPRSGEERARCEHVETDWHLAWKFAFLDVPGWEIEVPIEGVDAAYRADAFKADGRKVREFVHSLSPHYVAKHRSLKATNYDLLWVIDGEEFRSARLVQFRCRNGALAIKHMLKPRALDLARELKPNVLVHFDGHIYKAGEDDRYWFKVEGHEGVSKLLELHGKHLKVKV